MKKLTQDEFIEKAKEIHKEYNYDYSLVEYINCKTKIKIVCKEHGLFEQTPKNHLHEKHRCEFCSEHKLNTEIFIKKSKEKYGENTFIYDKTIYVKNSKNIIIMCKIHGDFNISPMQHLNKRAKYGCQACSEIYSHRTRKYSMNEFIEKAKEIHKEYNYDYSLVEYINCRTKVKIICQEHGLFEQTPHSHIKRYLGCDFCNGNRINTEIFIKKSKEKYGENTFIYDKTEYKSSHGEIIITCKIHGDFMTRGSHHLYKSGEFGCKYCLGAYDQTKEEFLLRANKIHGELYDYSFVEYVNTVTKIDIQCNKHGIFKQNPYDHLKGKGCPVCKNSKGELNIRKFLIENNIIFLAQKTFDGCKYKKKLRFDFYLSEYNILIEFDGFQHNKIVEYWGGEKAFNINKIKDEIKNEFCKSNNIKLLRIDYTNNTYKKIEKIIKKFLWN